MWLFEKINDIVHDSIDIMRETVGDAIVDGFETVGNRGIKKLEKIEMLFTDVEIEGKKRGYEKASKEYQILFKKLKTYYSAIINQTEIDVKELDNYSEGLLNQLALLENEKIELQKQLDNKIKQVSKKYGISQSVVYSMWSMSSEESLFHQNTSFDIVDIIYKHKEKKLHRAEQQGYEEAREIYIKKLEKEKLKLQQYMNKISSEKKNMVKLINEVLEEIASNETKIAELKILF